MKDKIGILALGQCGGNIGNLFEQQGFNCLFINTSKEDLATLNVKYRFHIPDGEGCSHDREKAISLVKKHYRRIIEEVSDKLFHQKIIYLCFSTSGGTGSGIAPILLEMLNAQFPDKYFGCITVLPSDDELPKPHMNSFQCYKELTQIDKLASVFTLDNNKNPDKFKINSSFVQRFTSILNIPKHTHIKGNIDNSELFKLLTTRGYAYISTCNSSNPDELTSTIIKSWEDSDIFADIENDKQIAYMGLSLTHDVNMEHLRKYIGTPFDVFTNYNRDMTYAILTGLTFPRTRINRIVDKLNSNKDTIKNNLTNAKTNRITDELNFLDEIEQSSKPHLDVDLQNLDDILSKYSA